MKRIKIIYLNRNTPYDIDTTQYFQMVIQDRWDSLIRTHEGIPPQLQLIQQRPRGKSKKGFFVLYVIVRKIDG